MSFRPQPSKARKSRLERVLEVGKTLPLLDGSTPPPPDYLTIYSVKFDTNWKVTLKENMDKVKEKYGDSGSNTFEEVAKLLKVENDALKQVWVGEDVLFIIGKDNKPLATFKTGAKTVQLLKDMIINAVPATVFGQ
jgi:hypothetical protein